MKLKFEILWFEDEYSQQMADEVRENSASCGFDVKFYPVKGQERVSELSKEQEKYHKYDLVLIDLNLEDGVKGHDLAVEIRESFKFTPILFYSGDKDEDELRQLMLEAKVDGVYVSDRSKFLHRAGELINDFAQSLNRLSGMRGLAAQIVAEIDGLCEKMILNLNQKSQLNLNSEIDKKLRDQIKSNSKRIEKFSDLEDRLSSPMVDSSKMFRLYLKLIREQIELIRDEDIYEELELLLTRIEKYQEDVLSKRNIFSHARESESPDGLEIKNTLNDKNISVKDFPEIRRTFIQYLENIREIERIFKENGLLDED